MSPNPNLLQTPQKLTPLHNTNLGRATPINPLLRAPNPYIGLGDNPALGLPYSTAASLATL